MLQKKEEEEVDNDKLQKEEVDYDNLKQEQTLFKGCKDCGDKILKEKMMRQKKSETFQINISN